MFEQERLFLILSHMNVVPFRALNPTEMLSLVQNSNVRVCKYYKEANRALPS